MGSPRKCQGLYLQSGGTTIGRSMNRLSAIIILIASLVPPLLAGRPVYSCLLTGEAKALVCPCNESREASGCCGDGCHDSSAAPAGSGDCCKVTIFEVICTQPRPQGEVDDSTVSALPASARELTEPRPSGTWNAAAFSPRASGDPPLYVLHATWLF